MIKKTILILNLIVFFSIKTPNACGNELSGYIGLEGRYFFQEARLAEQKNHSLSCVLEPEYYHKFSDQLSLTVVPFARIDNSDTERTHYDFRELNMQYVADKWEVTIGIEEVFWGVTEFVHLVNNINQTINICVFVNFQTNKSNNTIRICVFVHLGMSHTHI